MKRNIRYVSFSETSDVSVFGITADSTTEEIVDILGTPVEIGSMARDTNRREQSLYRGECEPKTMPAEAACYKAESG